MFSFYHGTQRDIPLQSPVNAMMWEVPFLKNKHSFEKPVVMPCPSRTLLSHRSSRPLPWSCGLEPSIPVPCLPWQPSQPMAPTHWACALPEALPTPGCILLECLYWDNWHLQNWSKEPEISSLESPGLLLTYITCLLTWKPLNRPASCISVPLSHTYICRPRRKQ